MDDYLSKPFTQAQLAAVLRQWFDAGHRSSPDAAAPGQAVDLPAGEAFWYENSNCHD